LAKIASRIVATSVQAETISCTEHVGNCLKRTAKSGRTEGFNGCEKSVFTNCFCEINWRRARDYRAFGPLAASWLVLRAFGACRTTFLITRVRTPTRTKTQGPALGPCVFGGAGSLRQSRLRKIPEKQRRVSRGNWRWTQSPVIQHQRDFPCSREKYREFRILSIDLPCPDLHNTLNILGLRINA